jgi:voltage-gated potassium channel
MAMLAVESRSDDANIRTSSDALWFMMVTISTVGYGDLYPTTGPGRIVGVFILIVGIGLFSTLTGFLANLFLSPRSKPASDESLQPAETSNEESAIR